MHTPAHLLTPAELHAVLARDPGATALFTDFDGTLSPIVADPASARPHPGAVEALAALTSRYRRVAVLSGRPLSYLQPLVPASIDIGALYGLEQRVGGVPREHPDAARWRPVIEELARRATSELGAIHTGVSVEPKGVSLTIHYRNAADPATAAAAVEHWCEHAAASSGLKAGRAKASIELHPPVAVDKGTLLTEWATGAATVAFFGDDLGDLPAFAALRRLAARTGIRSVNVVATSSETPDEVIAAADCLLDGPAAVTALLRTLAAG